MKAKDKIIEVEEVIKYIKSRYCVPCGVTDNGMRCIGCEICCILREIRNLPSFTIEELLNGITK